jgi:hypothetical protein
MTSNLWKVEGQNQYVVQRNFDPQTLDASTHVNGTIYSAYMYSPGNQNYMVPFPIDPFANAYTAVADLGINAGGYYTGLTCDDVGGLRYLLSTNNVNYETLLPSVPSHQAQIQRPTRPPIREWCLAAWH